MGRENDGILLQLQQIMFYWLRQKLFLIDSHVLDKYLLAIKRPTAFKEGFKHMKLTTKLIEQWLFPYLYAAMTFLSVSLHFFLFFFCLVIQK